MLEIKVKFSHRSYIYSELNFVCNLKIPVSGTARHLQAKASKKQTFLGANKCAVHYRYNSHEFSDK